MMFTLKVHVSTIVHLCRYHGEVPVCSTKEMALMLLQAYMLADRFQVAKGCIEKIAFAVAAAKQVFNRS